MTGVREETIADILWHSRRGMTAHYSMAQIVEIRDALELITDERNCFNKSLASPIREKSPQGRNENGLGLDDLTR